MKTKTVDKKCVAVVRGEKYERMYSGAHFRKTYKGTRLSVLRAIADKHCYGWEEDATEEQLLQNILEQNGDGCDYFTSFMLDGVEQITEQDGGEQDWGTEEV